MARALGATAVGLTAGFAGSAAPTAHSTSDIAAAELVASQFVNGFEGFSYQDPAAASSVADLATPALASVLTSPSQAAPGPALVAEKFTATASVVGFEVEQDTPTIAQLLARTDIRVSTSAGSSSSTRLVPVTLVHAADGSAPEGWEVSAVDGLTGSAVVTVPSSPTTVPPPAVPSTTPTTTPSGGAASTSASDGGPVLAVGDIPAAYVGWMQSAAASQCPGLPWTVLAGIGKVESDFGRSTLPGVHSGSNPEGAEGPMQFEPATFAAYGTVAPGGADPASPYDPADAIYSAARLLCADGGGSPAHLYAAIFDYNHSDAYVSLVLAYANQYAQMATGGNSPGVVARGLGSVIVADAETYLGTPYVWGGESPSTGFDCSGLVQWVYAEAGLSLPRVAQDQYDHGPLLPAGATLYPGDLVFFGSGPSAVDHVGIYVGNSQMIDAPYTGAVVRFDRVASVPLGFVGATRPEIPDLTGGAGVPVITTDHPDGGSSSGAGHPGGGAGHPAGSPRHPAGTSGTGGSSTGGRHHPTTTTTSPGSTTTPPGSGRHHPTGSTTTTDPTTTTTVPGGTTSTTVPKTGRHHPTTTTTTPPTTTTTPTTVPPTPATTTPTTVPTTVTTTAPSGTGTSTTVAPATSPRPGRHHGKGG